MSRFLPFGRGRDGSGYEAQSAHPPRLVLRFAIYSGVLLALAAAAVLLFVRHAERGRAERAATLEARLVADSLLPDRLRKADFLAPVEGTRRVELDRLFTNRVLLNDAVQADLVDPRGRITYSTDHSRIGQTTPDVRLVRTALGGTVVGAVGTGPGGGDVLNAVAPVSLTSGQRAGAFVLTRDYGPVAAAARKTLLPIVIVFELVLLGLYFALLPILRRVTNRLRHQMQELEYASLHDALTDLPNRTLFRRHIEQSVATAEREARGVAVLLLDLDRFKEINDTLGHASGDLLLQELAGRLESLLGEHGTVARLGGDEFGIVSRLAIDEITSLALAERVRARIAEPFMLAGVSLEVQASVGIALHPEHGRDAETLMRHADVAMYAAEKEHVARVYRPEENQHSSARLALVGQLRKAIEGGELELVFQPQLDVGADEVETVEALVRWRHPERGLLYPDDFVPLAENAGLIRPLTRAVLEMALAESRRWQDAGLSLRTAVNVSARDIVDLNLPDEIDAMLAKHRVDPSRLELEITESTLLTDPVRATTVIDRLSKLGVRIAIDDFGSGYSSLSHLRRLAVDVLKIDRSFVLNMHLDENDEAIVRCTIDLAHNLGLDVVAEGVESEASLRRLVGLGCDTVQGYHVSQPIAASALTRWLLSRQDRLDQDRSFAELRSA